MSGGNNAASRTALNTRAAEAVARGELGVAACARVSTSQTSWRFSSAKLPAACRPSRMRSAGNSTASRAQRYSWCADQ